METKKKIFFDLPMVLSILTLCGIMTFICYADNKQRTNDTAVFQRDSVEVVVRDNGALTFSE